MLILTSILCAGGAFGEGLSPSLYVVTIAYYKYYYKNYIIDRSRYYFLVCIELFERNMEAINIASGIYSNNEWARFFIIKSPPSLQKLSLDTFLHFPSDFCNINRCLLTNYSIMCPSRIFVN